MEFDLEAHADALAKKYTRKSIQDFLKNDWAKVRYPNENSWNAFVKNTEYLKEKEDESEDVIYMANGLPMPSWKIYVIADYLRMIYEIELTKDEREYFEVALAYLFYYKNVPFENIKEAIKKLIPLKEKFMKKFKSAKSLNTDEAKEIIKKMTNEYLNAKINKEDLKNETRTFN